MKFCFTLLSFFLVGFATAQTFTITGKVVNAGTAEPMKAASVFAQSTTLGTVTDENGNFRLQLPYGGYDLAITYSGYQTETRRINTSDASEGLQVAMKEKERELESVSVVASNEVPDGLAKYGSFFMDEFIGNTINAAQCRIRNPEILKFFFSKRKNRLKVTAAEPLIIENNALGYLITYSLDSFTHEYATELSTYSGYPLFEELPAPDDAMAEKRDMARRTAYLGSSLHFMRSVYNRDMKQQGFEMQFIAKMENGEKAVKLSDYYGALNFIKDDSTQIAEIRPNQPMVAVIYSAETPSAKYLQENPAASKKFQLSMLNFKAGETVAIEQNGYYYDQNDVTQTGYWTSEKVADQLPYDYKYYMR